MIEALGPMHESIIRQGLEFFASIKDPAIEAAEFRYRVSNPNIQLREPFKYENFKLAANRFPLYGEIVLRAGPSWLEYRFRSPIIWHPAPGYKPCMRCPRARQAIYLII